MLCSARGLARITKSRSPGGVTLRISMAAEGAASSGCGLSSRRNFSRLTSELPQRFPHPVYHFEPTPTGRGLLPSGRQDAPETNPLNNAVNPEWNRTWHSTHDVVTTPTPVWVFKTPLCQGGLRIQDALPDKKINIRLAVMASKRHKFLARHL